MTSVVGIHRELGVPSIQYQQGSVWAFDSWSDGAAESHIIATPAADTMYTVNFVNTGGACTLVRILQNRGDRYATLDAGGNLGGNGGTTQQADAEVFVREHTAQGFTLKATSNDNYVVLSGDGTDATVAAAGATGAILAEEDCGSNPAGFGAMRVDRNERGDQLHALGKDWNGRE